MTQQVTKDDTEQTIFCKNIGIAAAYIRELQEFTQQEVMEFEKVTDTVRVIEQGPSDMLLSSIQMIAKPLGAPVELVVLMATGHIPMLEGASLDEFNAYLAEHCPYGLRIEAHKRVGETSEKRRGPQRRKRKLLKLGH